MSYVVTDVSELLFSEFKKTIEYWIDIPVTFETVKVESSIYHLLYALLSSLSRIRLNIK